MSDEIEEQRAAILRAPYLSDAERDALLDWCDAGCPESTGEQGED